MRILVLSNDFAPDLQAKATFVLRQSRPFRPLHPGCFVEDVGIAKQLSNTGFGTNSFQLRKCVEHELQFPIGKQRHSHNYMFKSRLLQK